MFVYDPYQLHNMANNLTMAGVGYFVEMNQNMGGKRAKADKNLYDLIRDRRITIADDRVAQHIKNANASTEADGLRLKKRNNHSKIDLAVATSMACYEAFELNSDRVIRKA
jgi:phage terminase large subunit-like protein